MACTGYEPTNRRFVAELVDVWLTSEEGAYDTPCVHESVVTRAVDATRFSSCPQAPLAARFLFYGEGATAVVINNFKEYNYSPYDCFAHTEKIAENKYQIKAFGNKMPLCYSIVASKI